MGSASLLTDHFRPKMGPKYKGNGQNLTYGFVLAITFDPMHILKVPFSLVIYICPIHRMETHIGHIFGHIRPGRNGHFVHFCPF